MGGILWLYQTQKLFIICEPDTDVTWFSQGKLLTWSQKKEKKIPLIEYTGRNDKI